MYTIITESLLPELSDALEVTTVYSEDELGTYLDLSIELLTGNGFILDVNHPMAVTTPDSAVYVFTQSQDDPGIMLTILQSTLPN